MPFDSEQTSQQLRAVYVDMGTTNTRAWLMAGSRVIAKAAAPVGVRDSAREKSSETIRNGLREVISRVRAEALRSSTAYIADYIAAAGMIGSPLGLAEVLHVAAPAGLEELSAGAQWHQFDDVADLPFLLAPGVRCGPELVTVSSINEADVMRGEETLCAGLVSLEVVQRPGIVLNLGSHWKAIRLDKGGRIQSSVTSLSGELIHVTQQNTILSSSVAQERPQQFSKEWIEAGMAEERRSGLGRALFCTRLLDLAKQATAGDCLAFVVGAFIASDLDALMAGGVLNRNINVAIVGASGIAHAWHAALQHARISATIISGTDAENAFLTALRLILSRRLETKTLLMKNVRRTFSS